MSSISLETVCLDFIPGDVVYHETPYPYRVNSNEYDIQEENEIVRATCFVRIIFEVDYQALVLTGEMYFGGTPSFPPREEAGLGLGLGQSGISRVVGEGVA